MATYTVQDTQTGKNITFEWNGSKPPNDSDMAEVFSAAPAFQNQQSGQLPGRVVQPGISPQQAFYDQKMGGTMQPPDLGKAINDPGSFAEPTGWQKAAGIGLPIAGDIAMTFAAPQAQGPRLAGKLGNLLMRALGSAEGSYGGSLTGQQIEKGGVNTGEAGKEAALGFAGELGFGVLGGPAKWVAEKVSKPIAKGFRAITLTAPKVTQAMKDRLVKNATERSLKFVEDIAPDVVKRQDVSLGSVSAMVESAVSEKRAMYDFYETILRGHAEKSGGLISLPKTMDFLESQRSIIKDIDPGLNRVQLNKQLATKFNALGVHNEFRTLIETIKPLGSKSISGVSVDPEVITDILATVYKPGFKQGKKGFHNLPTKQLKDLREKLKETLLDDISEIQAKVEGKTAIQAKQEADVMTKALAQFKFVKGLFDKATRIGKVSTDLRLAPNQLADSIIANKGKIQREMPDLWPKLKAEADHLKSVAEAFSETPQQGLVQDAMRYGGVLGGSSLLGPVGIPIVEGIGAASAYFLMSPKGQKVLQKIVYGSVKGAGKAGLHIGGRQINFQERGR